MMHIYRQSAAAILVLSLPLAPAALAAEYPTKPIRIICGPGPDVLSRLFGEHFTKAWGEQVVVDQRPAVGGTVSAQMTAKAPPDGYTLLMITSSYSINTTLRPGSFDLVKDFSGIALAATSPFILLVNPSVKAQSVKDLVALAKASPGKLNYASSGTGSGPHLAFEMFKTAAGIDLVHVPYKGAAPAMVDLLSGAVQANFQIPAASLTNIRAGKIRALAVTSLKRTGLAPELPTLAELGYAGFDAIAWNGLVAPAGTPKAIIAKLNGELMKILKQPAVLKRIEQVGWEPAAQNTPEWFAGYIKREVAKWGKVVKDTGAKID